MFNFLAYCDFLPAIWSGAKLVDALQLLRIPKLTRATSSGGKHVEFVSIGKCKKENGGPYNASILLSHATNPEADVLLAYEMNGVSIHCSIENRPPIDESLGFGGSKLLLDHGYQLCVVVPGIIGARSVKWLDSINIIAEECQGFFMQKDYKMCPPSVNWDNIDWSTTRPQMDFTIQVLA
ncbi:hypothetical protein CsSME_00011428 [Camellia sinensis var. sinensis]